MRAVHSKLYFAMAGGVLHLWRTSMMSSMESMQQVKAILAQRRQTIAEVVKLFECVPRSTIDKYVAVCLVYHIPTPCVHVV